MLTLTTVIAARERALERASASLVTSRPSPGRRRTLVVVAGRKEDKSAKNAKSESKSDKKDSKDTKAIAVKALKPPTEAKATFKIGKFSLDVPVTLPQSVRDAPRPAVYAASALGLLMIKRVLFRGRRRSKGSLGELEDRGMLDENRDVDEEKFYKGMMKQVRTVQMPELTDEQIKAARERRRQSSGGDEDFSKSIAATEIPANHPWAMKETVTREQEEEQERRVLEANRPVKRRRAPPPSS